jgi:hypothetical protein
MKSEQEFQMFLAQGLHKLLINSPFSSKTSSKVLKVPTLFSSVLIGEYCLIPSDYLSKQMSLPCLVLKKISDGTTDMDVLLNFYNGEEDITIAQPNAEMNVEGQLLHFFISPTATVWKMPLEEKVI